MAGGPDWVMASPSDSASWSRPSRKRVPAAVIYSMPPSSRRALMVAIAAAMETAAVKKDPVK